MADESRYSDPSITGSGNKRKYDDQVPPPRRPTGFSSPDPANMPPSYNSVPPPANDIQAAKQRAQEIAARLLSGASAGAAAGDIKRPRVDNGGSGFDSFENKGFSSGPPDSKFSSVPSSIPPSYGSYLGGSSKKIDIPNGRVGVIIGKGGETIKYLQNQSGAKIQITRDMDADLSAPTRTVELMGTPDQVAKAEELINDVLAEAEAGSSGTVSRRFGGGQGGSEHFSMKIPNNKVGLVIGKGGETIKNIQARTGARVQVIPLHLPPGDTSTDRTVHIDGTVDQIEAAKQLVHEVTNENRGRNPMSGGYSQQGYQNRQPSNWGPPDASMQQPGYGYMQPGSYPPPSSQYNMSQPPYSGYGQPTSGGYSSGWDQSSAQTNQQKSQGYDYYNQPPPQQPPTTGAPPASAYNTGYNYGQPPAYGQQGQGYAQGGYGGYYQSGYGQAPQYDQQQGYNSASGYGNVASAGQEGKTPPSYGAQGDSTQGPPPPSTAGQQGYGTGQQPGANVSSYSSAPTSQPGYGVPPTSQAAYGNQPQAQPGYGPPTPAQKAPTTNPPVYGQSQQSPSTPGGYGQAPPPQPAYPYSQPPQSGYVQPESGLQRTPPPTYGAPAAQPGYGPPYGAPPAGQSAYGGQGPPTYNTSYGSGYSQPPAYPVDGNSSGNGTRGTYDAVPPASQTAQQTVAKASPKS